MKAVQSSLVPRERLGSSVSAKGRLFRRLVVILGLLMAAPPLWGQQERKIDPRFRLEHGGRVVSLAFSPDGKLLATGCGSTGLTVIWDLANGAKLRELSGNSDLINEVAFSPDGKSLAAGGRGKVITLWKVATGEETHQLLGHQDEIASVVFSPDGKSLLSAEILGEMRLWDSASGELRNVFTPLKGLHVYHLEWSPDGQFFAVGSTKTVGVLVDAKTGKAIGQLKGHRASVTRVRFSADGRTLATVSLDNKVRIWELSGDPKSQPFGAKELTSFPIENGPDDVCFLPDGQQVAVAHRDGRCSLWDLGTSQMRVNFEAHQGGTRVIAVSPDGKRLATGGVDKTSAVWDVEALTKPR